MRTWLAGAGLHALRRQGAALGRLSLPPRLRAALSQVKLSFQAGEWTASTNYTMTVVAWNDFGASGESTPFVFAPVRPFPSVLGSVFVQPSVGRRRLMDVTTEREPFGPLNILISGIYDGGSRELPHTLVCPPRPARRTAC